MPNNQLRDTHLVIQQDSLMYNHFDRFNAKQARQTRLQKDTFVCAACAERVTTVCGYKTLLVPPPDDWLCEGPLQLSAQKFEPWWPKVMGIQRGVQSMRVDVSLTCQATCTDRTPARVSAMLSQAEMYGPCEKMYQSMHLDMRIHRLSYELDNYDKYCEQRDGLQNGEPAGVPGEPMMDACTEMQAQTAPFSQLDVPLAEELEKTIEAKFQETTAVRDSPLVT